MRKSFENNLKQQNGRSKRDGFLHIPKTGGTGIARFLDLLADEVGPPRVPTTFNHPWSMQAIFRRFPDIRIHFIIRDPIDRMVSGFLSRMRMGRPMRNHLWSVPEATAFSFFNGPALLLRALISDDEREKSAALFALASIRHLKWNYVHYFTSVEYIDQIESRLGIIRTMNDVGLFLDEICALSGVDAAMVEKHYQKLHVSEVLSQNVTAQMGEAELARVRTAFEPEYLIYRRLQAIAQRQSAS